VPVNSPDINHKPKVLVVDDEEALLEILVEECELMGCLAFSATGGKEALDVLALTPIDIVISDIAMPKMSGLDLLKCVRTKYGMKQQFALMSGHSDVSLWDAYHFGAEAYLGKPFSTDDLKSLIARANNMDICLAPDDSFDGRNMLISGHISEHSIGRRGVFVAIDDEFLTRGAKIDFSLAQSNTNLQFRGTGIVRWVRRQSSSQKYASGIGIEIISLDKTALEFFNCTVPVKTLIPFIPRE
jgi:CheY-like chemotaxis protein